MGTLDGTLSSDIDGDGSADVCARSSKGIGCYASGDGFVTPIEGPALSNESGWDKPEFFGTIRMGDVNGDEKADVCARASAGIACWLSNGTGFPEKIDGPAWSNANGWNKTGYWSTIRLADIDGDGKADLCARSSTDFRCHRSTGTGFETAAIIGPGLSNESGWNHDHYFGTIRMADVNGDGKADVCARSSTDFSCWLSDGAGFPDKITGPALSNDSSWNEVEYWSTLRMPDVNGDGKADLCGRAAAGLRCWLSEGTSFSEAIIGPELSNEKGWNKVQYYSTLRFADLDSDGKDDVCARSSAGLRCWLSDGAGFPTQIVGDMMSDENGWNKAQFYSTFRLSDANGDGRADACARAAAGVLCWHFDGTAFGSSVAGPAWTDDNGWNKFMYYSTLQIAGGCVATAETCNQADDDCDGEIDEGDVCDGWGDGGATGGGGSSAGSGGKPSSSGGSASNADPAEESDEAGCSCRTSGSPSGRAPLVVGLGLLAFAFTRRRAPRECAARRRS
jgi:MYXO-CTERM domain-containing protein